AMQAGPVRAHHVHLVARLVRSLPLEDQQAPGCGEIRLGVLTAEGELAHVAEVDLARLGRHGHALDEDKDRDEGHRPRKLDAPRGRGNRPRPRAAAAARRPRQAVRRGETARRLPVAGPGRPSGAGAHSGAARPDRGREREAGPPRDAADLRGAQDRRAGEPQPPAGGPPRERLRPAREPVAGGQVRPPVTQPAAPGAAGSAAAAPAPLDQRCINAIRALAMDAVQRANSGHPGTPMALAPLAYVLWQRHLRNDPANPDWFGRDRFVLSCGHACMLLYAVLYLTGYDLSLDDLKQFRQWGSRTPGHPEHGLTPGVEATTGPLGQGVGNAVGMALAEAHLAARFNRPGHAIVDHYTYFLASDGDLMEGVSHE